LCLVRLVKEDKMPKVLPKRAEPQPAKPKIAKPVGTQFGPEPSQAAAKPKGLKTLPSIGQPKSPAAKVSGQRKMSMPSWPSWGAKSVGQTVHKLPPLSTLHSAPSHYKGGTSD